MISIVLPTYNGEHYLRESIDSIIQQTIRDWELIIVDDCSTDNTFDIVENYARIDSRIHVIHNRINQKLPGSLNIGFRHAKGEYLTWTSDDNRYLPTALERMYQVLRNSDVEMVCAGMYLIDADGKVTGEGLLYDESKMLLYNTVGACFMYTRKVLTEVGEYNSERFCIEDYEYWLRIYKTFGHIEYIPERLYQYRLHDQNLTATRQKEIRLQRCILLEQNIDAILEQFQHSKMWLLRVYYFFIGEKYEINKFKNKFLNLFPLLVNESEDVETENRYIIFGAGSHGSLAYDLLRDRVLCFADNNPLIIGTKKENIDVLSIENAIEKYTDGKVLIAVNLKHTYDIIQQLDQMGIKRYWTYQRLSRDYN